MKYEITNTITPEEYLEMRALVGWGGISCTNFSDS